MIHETELPHRSSLDSPNPWCRPQSRTGRTSSRLLADWQLGPRPHVLASLATAFETTEQVLASPPEQALRRAGLVRRSKIGSLHRGSATRAGDKQARQLAAQPANLQESFRLRRRLIGPLRS